MHCSLCGVLFGPCWCLCAPQPYYTPAPMPQLWTVTVPVTTKTVEVCSDIDAGALLAWCECGKLRQHDRKCGWRKPETDKEA